MAGHVKPAQVTPKHIREFRVDQIPEDLKVGSEINVSAFEVGDFVDATGTSKGKGFAGTIKRHNLSVIVRRTVVKVILVSRVQLARCIHKKVFKGKTMAGHMGHERVTVKNLEVAYVDPETNLIGVKGAVPGPRKGLIILGGNK